MSSPQQFKESLVDLAVGVFYAAFMFLLWGACSTITSVDIHVFGARLVVGGGGWTLWECIVVGSGIVISAVIFTRRGKRMLKDVGVEIACRHRHRASLHGRWIVLAWVAFCACCLPVLSGLSLGGGAVVWLIAHYVVHQLFSVINLSFGDSVTLVVGMVTFVVALTGQMEVKGEDDYVQVTAHLQSPFRWGIGLRRAIVLLINRLRPSDRRGGACTERKHS